MVQDKLTQHIKASDPFYITLLRAEFSRRKAKNRAYSLSAFSRSLELDQSLFSKILSGKKKITERLATELLLRAGISHDTISGALGGFASLAEDEFGFLSDWLPFAILELAKTERFKWDTKWIAARLRAHPEEVLKAMRSLERFGYIEATSKGKIKLLKPNNTWANTKKTSMARQQLQKKFVEMSLDAIENIPFDSREHGSLTIAINVKHLPELKERLNQFRMELGRFLQEDDELNEVYQITTSVFPLTKLGEKT